jgi:hypothetical protein
VWRSVSANSSAVNADLRRQKVWRTGRTDVITIATASARPLSTSLGRRK